MKSFKTYKGFEEKSKFLKIDLKYLIHGDELLESWQLYLYLSMFNVIWSMEGGYMGGTQTHIYKHFFTHIHNISFHTNKHTKSHIHMLAQTQANTHTHIHMHTSTNPYFYT